MWPTTLTCHKCRPDRQLAPATGCEHLYVDCTGQVWIYRPWAHTVTWEPGMLPPLYQAVVRTVDRSQQVE